MGLILAALIPVFGLITLGFLCGRTDFLGAGAFEILNRFVIVLTLPVLTFRTLARMDSSGPAVPPMLFAVLGGALAIYALAFAIERALGRPAGEANIVALAASFGNTSFVGLPIVVIMFGSSALAPAAVAIALNAAIIFGLGILVAEMSADRGAGIAGAGAAVARLARNPLILSSVLGFGWAITGLPLSGPVDVLLATLASATAPCALIAIGLFMARPRAPVEPGVMARVLLLKLFGQPAITLAIVAFLPGMPPVWSKTAVLMAAMPTGTSSFMLAGGAGRWAMETSGRAILLTTIMAAGTLTLVLLGLFMQG